MRTDLQVPFAEKDEAKRLGARWDPARKVWYVQNKPDLTPFARWLPAAAATTATGSRPGTAGKSKAAGIVVVGSRYVEQPRVCDCLPWEDCDRCRRTTVSVIPTPS